MEQMYQGTWKEPFLAPPRFEIARSAARLAECAKRAPNISLSGAITPERITSMMSHGAGLTLLYGFERVDQEILQELQALADERRVVDQMKALFAGQTVNWIEGYESEKRSALHPAARDVFGLATTSDFSARRLIEAELQKLREFFDQIGDRYTTLLFIGIGGSELGPRALAEAMERYAIPGRQVRYLANIDPDETTVALSGVDLKRTLVAVVSKSGATLETATNEARVRQAYLAAGIDPREHCIAVTCPKTMMDDPSKYRTILHLFDFIGGRFSATSVVGGLLVSFVAGVNCFFELLGGANEMDRLALRIDIRDNLPLLLALLGVWNRNFLRYPTVAVIPYSRALRRFPAHLQQCEMESNGKSIDRYGRRVPYPTGAVVWGEPGTNAQHSFFQLLHQGTDIVPVEFIGFQQSQYDEDSIYNGTSSQDKLLANLFAQAMALATGKDNENPNKYFSGNRPSAIILGKKLDAATLGALLALYEHKVAFQGFVWGINSFDQEGVQLGKMISEQVLDVMRNRREGKEDVTAPAVGRRLVDILEDIGSAHRIMSVSPGSSSAHQSERSSD
jgi:glucose-6-phosphate isomerase